MKKLSIIAVLVLTIIAWSCGNKREPGRVYMPDMAYSRAVESYSSHDTLHAQGINYNATPVAGTIKRGELFPFPLGLDSAGKTTNYEASKLIANPVKNLTPEQMIEAGRLYLVNCGICHGTNLDGKGVLHKRSDGTDGPYAAAPAVLVGNPLYENMPDGQMMYSVTHGKGQMGSYASQLSTTQRWQVIHYIKQKQAEAKGGAAGGTDSTAAATDTTAKK